MKKRKFGRFEDLEKGVVFYTLVPVGRRMTGSALAEYQRNGAARTVSLGRKNRSPGRGSGGEGQQIEAWSARSADVHEPFFVFVFDLPFGFIFGGVLPSSQPTE